MKLIKEEISPADHIRYVFALGKEELELILGLLEKFKSSMPISKKWKPENQRTTNLIREIKKII